MSLNALRKGQRIKAGASEFLILRTLPDSRWQLQNAATGEWCTFTEDDLLDRFARSEMSFIAEAEAWWPAGGLAMKLTRDLAACPPELRSGSSNARRLVGGVVSISMVRGSHQGDRAFLLLFPSAGTAARQSNSELR
jgi:hypothetical protein